MWSTTTLSWHYCLNNRTRRFLSKGIAGGGVTVSPKNAQDSYENDLGGLLGSVRFGKLYLSIVAIVLGDL